MSEQNNIDPELIKLLNKIPAEDLKDLLAQHGAGSVERQADAGTGNPAPPPVRMELGPETLRTLEKCSGNVYWNARPSYDEPSSVLKKGLVSR